MSNRLKCRVLTKIPLRIAPGPATLVDYSGSVLTITAQPGLAVASANYSFAAAVSSNNLTITVNDETGAPLSPTNTALFRFRDLLTGRFVMRALLTSPTLTITSGSLMGFTNGIPGRLWIVGVDDGGVFRIGAGCFSTAGRFYRLNEDALYSTTAEGGAGAADSAGVIYTDTGTGAKAIVILGYLDWPNGLATAGLWNVNPSPPRLYYPGVPLPGQPIGNAIVATAGTALVGTSSAYMDSALSASITPSNACNFIAASWAGALLILQTNIHGQAALRRGGAVLDAKDSWCAAGSYVAPCAGFALDKPGSTAVQTYTVAVRNSDNVTQVYFPYSNTDSKGQIALEELQG